MFWEWIPGSDRSEILNYFHEYFPECFSIFNIIEIKNYSVAHMFTMDPYPLLLEGFVNESQFIIGKGLLDWEVPANSDKKSHIVI